MTQYPHFARRAGKWSFQAGSTVLSAGYRYSMDAAPLFTAVAPESASALSINALERSSLVPIGLLPAIAVADKVRSSFQENCGALELRC